MTPFLEFRQVSYTYPYQPQAAVHNVSFTIQRGEWVGILGANESGKSTLAKLTNGLLVPSQGQVIVDGLPVAQDETVYTVRQKVGVVFADPENQIVGTTVEEDVAFGLGNICVPPPEIRRRVQYYLEQVGLWHAAKRAPHQLSGGEQQKLCLASVLAMQPECLVLDDPLTFLDQTSQQEILAFLTDLHKNGRTMLSFTSVPEELIHTDRILLLRHGEIIAENLPHALWNNLPLLEQAGIIPPNLQKIPCYPRRS